MAKFKSYDRGQGYFVNFIPTDHFDEYSIEMIIDKIVEEQIDSKMFNYKYTNDLNGQKAIHPFLKLKVILYSFCQGIQSARVIDKMIKSGHLGYMFLSSNTKMDHSTLSIFINDFKEEIQTVFSKLLILLNNLELIDWDLLMIDGTKVSSFADKELTSDAIGFSKKLKRYNELSRKIIERSKRIEQEEELGKISQDSATLERKRIERQKQKYDSIIKKIENYEEEVENKIINNKQKINLSDRESRLLKDKDRYIQGYNVQAVYSANDVIVDIEAVSESNDIKQLEVRVNNVERLKNGLNINTRSKYLADKGYCNPKDITNLMDAEKNIYCAIPDLLKNNWINDEKYTVIKEDGKIFFKCSGDIKKKGYLDKKESAYIFIISQSKCTGCGNFDICWENKKKQKNRKFKISSVLIDKHKNWNNYCGKMSTEDSKYIYNKRIGKEHNFYDLKEHNGLHRIFRRGYEKSNAVVLLAAIAHNLKKLSKYLELKGEGLVFI